MGWVWVILRPPNLSNNPRNSTSGGFPCAGAPDRRFRPLTDTKCFTPENARERGIRSILDMSARETAAACW